LIWEANNFTGKFKAERHLKSTFQAGRESKGGGLDYKMHLPISLLILGVSLEGDLVRIPPVFVPERDLRGGGGRGGRLQDVGVAAVVGAAAAAASTVVRVVGGGGRGLAVEVAVAVVAVGALQVGLAQFEEADEAGDDEGGEAEDLLEGGQSQDEGQEEQKLQLEQLQDDQQGDEQLLQLGTRWK